MIGHNVAVLLFQSRCRLPATTPTPSVTKPKLWRHGERGALRSAVYNRDADQNVVNIVSRILREHVEIAVVVKSAGIGELKLWRLLSAFLILIGQPLVRIFKLRVLIERFQI